MYEIKKICDIGAFTLYHQKTMPKKQSSETVKKILAKHENMVCDFRLLKNGNIKVGGSLFLMPIIFKNNEVLEEINKNLGIGSKISRKKSRLLK